MKSYSPGPLKRPGTLDREHQSWMLSAIIPVYNEEATVARAIRRVRELPWKVEIIVVDDASTDGTRAILQRLHEAGEIDTLVLRDLNGGKGTAVRAAIAHCTGGVGVIQDADLEYDPADIPQLMQPILDGRADAVFGSRLLGGPHRVLYFWHRVGNSVLTLLSNMLTDLNLTDMETCYKMVRADLLRSLPLCSDRFGVEPELTARLAQAQARIYEVPISYSGRTYAEGKKINWKDGVAALWHILRFNLLPPRARPLPARNPAESPPVSARAYGIWRGARGRHGGPLSGLDSCRPEHKRIPQCSY